MNDMGNPTMTWKENSFKVEQTPAAWEFYNLKDDPSENINLYNDPAYKEIIAELKTELKNTREELNETDKDYPHIQEIIDQHWND